MKRRTWLWMMSGLCCAVVTVRADAPPVVVVAPDALPTVDLQVDASDAGTSAVWEAMQKGSLSPEEAWKQGLLDAATVQAGLSKGLAGGEDTKSMQLRLALGKVLVQHAPEVVKDALKLPRHVQLALADYYASVGDERAIALYDVVLKQTKAPYEQGLVLKALGNFYATQNKPEQAQDAYLRGHAVLKGHANHFAAEMVLLTARAWTIAGNSDKAHQFYSQVREDGDGWMTGMALYEQGQELMSKGNYEQARAILTQPVEGDRADQIKAALASSLAFSYYRTGDFEKARVACEQSISLFKAIKAPSGNLEGQVNNAKFMLTWIDRWKNVPTAIYCEGISPIFVNEEAPPSKPVTRQLAIRSLRPEEVSVTTSDPRIKVRPVDFPADAGFFFQKIYEIEVAPENMGMNFETSLLVRSPKHPDFQAQVTFRFQRSKNRWQWDK